MRITGNDSSGGGIIVVLRKYQRVAMRHAFVGGYGQKRVVFAWLWTLYTTKGLLEKSSHSWRETSGV